MNNNINTLPQATKESFSKQKIISLLTALTLTLQGCNLALADENQTQRIATENQIAKEFPTLKIVNFVSGQNDEAILATTEKGESIMIDTGYIDMNLIQKLHGQGVTELDIVYITHPHLDHYGGLLNLLQNNFPIKKIVLSPGNSALSRDNANIQNIIDLATSQNIPLLIPHNDGQRWIIGNNTMQLIYTPPVLNPENLPDSGNEQSIILKLTTRKGVTILFPGDMSPTEWNWIVAQKPLTQFKNISILFTPHHSVYAPNEYQPSFYDFTNPNILISSTHPNVWKTSQTKKDYAKSYQMAWKNDNPDTYKNNPYINEGSFDVNTLYDTKSLTSGVQEWARQHNVPLYGPFTGQDTTIIIQGDIATVNGHSYRINNINKQLSSILPGLLLLLNN